jgi:hypothetical protein
VIHHAHQSPPQPNLPSPPATPTRRKLFQELAKVGVAEQQTLCLQMVDEIEPSMRYCNYQISRKGGAPLDPAQLLELAGGGGDLLQVGRPVRWRQVPGARRRLPLRRPLP